MPETNLDIPPSKRLLTATMPFAEEIPFRSWWHVASTFLLLGSFVVGAAALP